MAMRYCPQCGQEVGATARFCSSCGTKLQEETPEINNTDAVQTSEPQSAPTTVEPQSGTAVAESQEPKKPAVRRAPRIVLETPKPQREIKKRTPLLVGVAFVIALMLVGAGLLYYFSIQSENEQHAYDDAMASTAAVVLESYLSLYPDAPAAHRAAVTQRLDELNDADSEWDSVLVSNTLGDYENYIVRHPHSIHITEATLRVDSLHWLRAEADSTFEAYKAYITAHPDGIFVDEARMRAERLDPLNVSEEDKQRIRVAIAKYFKTLAAKENNTVLFTVNDDIDVEKQVSAPDSLTWNVTFNADRKTMAADPTQSTLTVLKYTVILSPEMEITDVKSEEVQ